MAVVLVTGGNRGIGAACVAWFLSNGDRVATTYRSAEPPRVPEGADAEGGQPLYRVVAAFAALFCVAIGLIAANTGAGGATNLKDAFSRATTTTTTPFVAPTSSVPQTTTSDGLSAVSYTHLVIWRLPTSRAMARAIPTRPAFEAA